MLAPGRSSAERSASSFDRAVHGRGGLYEDLAMADGEERRR
jgi:hypothetical protein